MRPPLHFLKWPAIHEKILQEGGSLMGPGGDVQSFSFLKLLLTSKDPSDHYLSQSARLIAIKQRTEHSLATLFEAPRSCT